MAGRPSKFSDKLADTICDMLMDGMSMVKICALEEMPHRVTVIKWMANDDDFATKCARARAYQADLMDDMILDCARECTAETAAADRVRISAYQWRAAKLMPKVYGEKVQHTGAGDAPLFPSVTVLFGDGTKTGDE